MTRTLLATAALLATCSALAQQSPWYVGAAQGFTYTSNARQVSDGNPADSATISTTTLVAGLDQPIGRQRLFGSASLRHLAYSGASDLNHQAYDLRLGLDWSTVERISGSVNLQASRKLELLQALELGPGGFTVVGQKNQQSNESLQATVRVGVVTALTLEGSLAWRRQDMSLARLDGYDYTSNATSLGLRYRFSGALQAGAALRHTEYDYPRYGGGPNEVKRDDLDLTTTWVASGASTLDARLSFGRSRHSQASEQAFSGATGSVTWRWQPTGKLRFNTTLQRDTGVDSYLQQSLGTNVATREPTDRSRLTTALATRVNYEVSGKVNATASLRLARRSLSDPDPTPGAPASSTISGSDRSTALSLGATWAPTRSVLVGCDLSHDQRRSSYVYAAPYKVDTFGCYAQLVLQ